MLPIAIATQSALAAGLDYSQPVIKCQKMTQRAAPPPSQLVEDRSFQGRQLLTVAHGVHALAPGGSNPPRSGCLPHTQAHGQGRPSTEDSRDSRSVKAYKG